MEQWEWKHRVGRRGRKKWVCVSIHFKFGKHLDHYNAGGDLASIFTHTQSPESSCSSQRCRSVKINWTAFTSLNSWIWACSNIEKTLELAPSAVLLLAFLGALQQKERPHRWDRRDTVVKTSNCQFKFDNLSKNAALLDHILISDHLQNEVTVDTKHFLGILFLKKLIYICNQDAFNTAFKWRTNHHPKLASVFQVSLLRTVGSSKFWVKQPSYLPVING